LLTSRLIPSVKIGKWFVLQTVCKLKSLFSSTFSTLISLLSFLQPSRASLLSELVRSENHTVIPATVFSNFCIWSYHMHSFINIFLLFCFITLERCLAREGTF